MTSDRPGPHDDAGNADGWLDGLAGRAGDGDAHRQGARVRAALAPGAHDKPTAPWHAIEARAGVAASPESVASAPHPQTDAMAQRPQAANDASPWRWLGWAAAVLLSVALLAQMVATRPDEGSTLRGVPLPEAQGPQWRVEQPVEAARQLADELRTLRADVTVTVVGDGAVLDISAPPDAVTAVNARLSALETGLDPTGRLQLTVRPPR
jgi:hypothetical protein